MCKMPTIYYLARSAWQPVLKIDTDFISIDCSWHVP